jgi:hypothetical protein
VGVGDEVAELVGGVRARLADRLRGLDDAEYLWEPVPGCWSVRPAEDGWRADTAADGTHFAADPQPFTTIAWRLWHVGASPRPGWPPLDAADAAEFVQQWFGGPVGRDIPAFGTAAEAVRAVDEYWARFADRCRRFSADELAGTLGPTGGQWADASFLGLLLHIADELIHHGAEVGVLRDLYAHRS